MEARTGIEPACDGFAVHRLTIQPTRRRPCSLSVVVEPKGVEPLASSLPERRSPTELRPQYDFARKHANSRRAE